MKLRLEWGIAAARTRPGGIGVARLESLMDERYIVERIPEQGALKCDVCGDDLIGEKELSEADHSTGNLQDLLEGIIRHHVESEHAAMFEEDFEILIHSDATAHVSAPEFPDEALTHDVEPGKIEKTPPPRSPDETES